MIQFLSRQKAEQEWTAPFTRKEPLGTKMPCKENPTETGIAATW